MPSPFFLPVKPLDSGWDSMRYLGRFSWPPTNGQGVG
jgi:hypothetical protein